MTPRQLRDELDRYVYRRSSEKELQDGIERALTASGVPFIREYRLSPAHRLDFLCGNVAVEVKIDGSANELTRQVHGYLQDPRLQGVLVVTTLSKHRSLPSSISGKAIEVLWVRPTA